MPRAMWPCVGRHEAICWVFILLEELGKHLKTIKAKCSKQKTVKSMADVNPNISIITLNMNCLNIPIKRQGLTK